MNAFPLAPTLIRNFPLIVYSSCQPFPLSSRIQTRQLSLSSSEPDKKLPGDADPKKKDYTPIQLIRPLGMENPPQRGENAGIDTRTVQQKRDDFVNWDKHLQKRKKL